MAVYVDNERNRFRRMVMCHMFADTPAELHDMAERIGMHRRWYQTPDGPKPASFPHYDVCLMRRAKAVELGAIEVDRRQGYEVRKGIRQRIISDGGFAASWRFAAALPTANEEAGRAPISWTQPVDRAEQRAREMLAAEGCVEGFRDGELDRPAIVDPRAVMRAITKALTDYQSDMPTIWEDPAGKGYPCFERPMTPAECKEMIERLYDRLANAPASGEVLTEPSD